LVDLVVFKLPWDLVTNHLVSLEKSESMCFKNWNSFTE
jgi:hypothetical protein